MIILPFALMSQIMKRPLGSERVFMISKSKLLLKRMHAPALLLVQQLKRALYPHSAVHK